MKGITPLRRACILPMDETLTRVAHRYLGGRPFLVCDGRLPRADKVGDFDTELVREWFQAFAHECRHHAACRDAVRRATTTTSPKSCFKGLARALRAAVAIDPRTKDAVPSTKGRLAG